MAINSNLTKLMCEVHASKDKIEQRQIIIMMIALIYFSVVEQSCEFTLDTPESKQKVLDALVEVSTFIMDIIEKVAKMTSV